MKPMLACSTIPNVQSIDYPVLASPKMDGIRCLIIEGKAYSRYLQLIPNKHIQDSLQALNMHGFDGELMLKTGDFNNVQSAVMSADGRPDFEYVVFDYFDSPNTAYSSRLMKAIVEVPKSNLVRTIPMIVAHTAKQMSELYEEWLNDGYEGAIVRNPSSPYKYGRSTLKQGWMLKLKNFDDAEAVITGFEELQHNYNEATVGTLGETKRSHHQENKHGGNTLGALVCSFNGVVVKLGTGFTSSERARLWSSRDKLIGQHVTFKYQELSKYGVPRFPVYKGIRYERAESTN